jgi:hypothetical protein
VKPFYLPVRLLRRCTPAGQARGLKAYEGRPSIRPSFEMPCTPAGRARGLKAYEGRLARFGAVALAVALAACGHAYAASGPGTGTSAFQCAPYQVLGPAPYPTNSPYSAGADGVVTGASPNDTRAFENAGCRLLGAGGSSYEMIGRLVGANMNATTDQPFLWLAAPATSYRVTKITCTNASTSLTTAAGGVYTQASKAGTPMVAATQVYTALTGSTLAVDLTLAATPAATFYSSSANPPILSLTTAQGAAATADCYVYGQLGQ